MTAYYRPVHRGRLDTEIKGGICRDCGRGSVERVCSLCDRAEWAMDCSCSLALSNMAADEDGDVVCARCFYEREST